MESKGCPLLGKDGVNIADFENEKMSMISSLLRDKTKNNFIEKSS